MQMQIVNIKYGCLKTVTDTCTYVNLSVLLYGMSFASNLSAGLKSTLVFKFRLEFLSL